MGGKVREPKTGRKGGPLSNARKDKIKEEIIKLAEMGNLPSRSELARTHKVNRRTLNTLFEEVKDLIPKDTPELLKVDIIKTYERMKRRIMFWWDKCENAPEDEQSFILEKQVYEQLLKVLKDYRETLIVLGILEDSSTQNIHIQGVLINAEVDLNKVIQDIKS